VRATATPPDGEAVAAQGDGWLRALRLAGVLVALGGAGWLATRTQPTLPEPAAVAHEALAAPTASAAVPVVAPAPERATPTVPEPSPVPAWEREPPSTHPQAAPRPARSKHPPPEVSDPDAELALLRGARRALDDAPVRSLALTAEHAQRFPRGVFVQERELIAIEALVRSERFAQAQTRAARFRKAHPSSAHLERLEVLLERTGKR